MELLSFQKKPISEAMDAEKGIPEESKGAMLSFHNINYSVKVKPPGAKCCGGTMDKLILKDISGIFKPGLNAIMGATGSGKTSLLDVLAGRKDPAGLKGDILIDGKLPPKNYKCVAGYVVQDDVVMGTLTIRENFMFSANLRMPPSTSLAEKKRRVEETVIELGLTECVDSKVGTEFIRGVSGGERKRTNIGMELILSPSVLFLDEPTTGLDASTSNAVLYQLYKLGQTGRTIIFSIHQPRYSIYKLFSRLMLLSQGHPVYHGPSDEAVEYFKSIGHECETYNNPPDFFLDVINGDSSAVQLQIKDEKEERQGSKEHIGLDMNGIGNKVGSSFEADEVGNLAQDLTEKYRDSVWNKNMLSEIEPIYMAHKSKQDEGTVDISQVSYATSAITQFRYVSVRTILNIFRNPATSILQMFILSVFGIIVGTIYFQMPASLEVGIQNRVGAFFFIIMNLIFGNLSSIELFIKERVIFIHENSNGFYRVSVYFLSKVFCDVIPMRAIPNIIFSLIVYFMTGLELNIEKFFLFLLNVLLTSLSAASIGFFMSASVKIFAIANLLTALLYVIMMVFGGVLVNLDSLLPWLQWLKYLSLYRYSLNALSINELKGKEFCGNFNGTTICDPEAGNDYLRIQGIPFETYWDYWLNEIALFCITTGFLILTYIQLRRINKLK